MLPAKTITTKVEQTYEQGQTAKPRKCPNCRLWFPTRQLLISHETKIHQRHKCTYCKATFATVENAILHKEHQHNLQCTICGKKLVYKTSLRKHIDIEHEKKRYECDICQKTFTQHRNLTKHTKAVHYKLKHTCPICKKELSMSHDMTHHLKRVHKYHKGKRMAEKEAKIQQEQQDTEQNIEKRETCQNIVSPKQKEIVNKVQRQRKQTHPKKITWVADILV